SCVKHEVDVIARNKHKTVIIECKFHSLHGKNCDVKVPLYIDSRYRDIKHYNSNRGDKTYFDEGWVTTNTRFTEDALAYGKCAGLYLLSWDYPKGNGLKDRIDDIGLYPITVSNILTGREKNF